MILSGSSPTGSEPGSTGECLLYQVLKEAVGFKNTLEVLEFRLSQCGVTDLVGSVTHTSHHPCDGSLVVVRVEGDVAVHVGGLVIDPCAQSGFTPGHEYVQEGYLVFLLVLNGEFDVWVLSIDVPVKTLQFILSVRPNDECIIYVA